MLAAPSFWEKATNDPVAYFTLWLVIFTGILAVSTIGLWIITWLSGKRQNSDMRKSMRIADDSAQATRSIATTMQENARKQMRAYLSVSISTGIYQDDRFRFEGKPALTNTGFTPAHNVRYWAKAEIFPYPLPEGFNLPVEEGVAVDSGAVLAPHHSYEMSAVINRRIPDIEANDAKLGNGKRLYVWGKIIYEDIFGEVHYTKFFHSIYWLITDNIGTTKVIGHYESKNNEAD